MELSRQRGRDDAYSHVQVRCARADVRSWMHDATGAWRQGRQAEADKAQGTKSSSRATSDVCDLSSLGTAMFACLLPESDPRHDPSKRLAADVDCYWQAKAPIDKELRTDATGAVQTFTFEIDNKCAAADVQVEFRSPSGSLSNWYCPLEQLPVPRGKRNTFICYTNYSIGADDAQSRLHAARLQRERPVGAARGSGSRSRIGEGRRRQAHPGIQDQTGAVNRRWEFDPTLNLMRASYRIPEKNARENETCIPSVRSRRVRRSVDAAGHGCQLHASPVLRGRDLVIEKTANSVELTDNQGGLGCWLPTKASPGEANLCGVADGQPHVFHVVVTNKCLKDVKAQIKFEFLRRHQNSTSNSRRARPAKRLFERRRGGISSKTNPLKLCARPRHISRIRLLDDRKANYDVNVLKVDNKNVTNGHFDPEVVIGREEVLGLQTRLARHYRHRGGNVRSRVLAKSLLGRVVRSASI